MSKPTRALRVGLFVVLGLALLVVAIAYVLGGKLFTSHEPIRMRFSGSVYGLQVGSPVVFRGVAIGSVSSIGLALNGRSGQIEIPVAAQLDAALVRPLGLAAPAGSEASPAVSTVQPTARQTLQHLIGQGLSARLATQSLLTGQLYVDLDLRPDPSRLQIASPPEAVPDVPTLPTTLQALQAQLEGIDLKAALKDVAAIASATRVLLQDPQLKSAVANAAQLTADLRVLTQSLQRELGPLSKATHNTLTDARQAATALSDAATRIAQTAKHLDATLAADSPLLQSFQNSTRELAATAISLREATGEDAELVQNLNRATREVSRAARQLSELSQLIERQPDLLLRGRKANP
ncbi:MAG: MCE family protein [Comamonadaceae bacterium]|nr:MCE family protein [Comamonadaceae bacterium]